MEKFGQPTEVHVRSAWRLCTAWPTVWIGKWLLWVGRSTAVTHDYGPRLNQFLQHLQLPVKGRTDGLSREYHYYILSPFFWRIPDLWFISGALLADYNNGSPNRQRSSGRGHCPHFQQPAYNIFPINIQVVQYCTLFYNYMLVPSVYCSLLLVSDRSWMNR